MEPCKALLVVVALSLGPHALAQGYPPGSYPPPPPPYYAPYDWSLAHRHVGFFLRPDIGIGFLSAGETINGSTTKISGGTVDLGFSIGGAIAEDNILAAHIYYAVTSSPNFSYSNGGSGIATNTDYGVGGFGPEYTHYFMPVNLFLSGAILLTRATATDTYGGLYYSSSTSAGIGLKFAIGKEWWVSPHWGIGVAGHLVWSSNRDSGLSNGTGTLNTGVFTVAFSATYN